MKDSISYEDFAKLDFRIGEVMEAEPVEGSEKLLALTVNLGEEYGTREILAGVAKYYSTDDIIGRKLIFLANLEPRKMMGRESQGMMIAVNDESKPILIPIEQTVENGTSLA